MEDNINDEISGNIIKIIEKIENAIINILDKILSKIPDKPISSYIWFGGIILISSIMLFYTYNIGHKQGFNDNYDSSMGFMNDVFDYLGIENRTITYTYDPYTIIWSSINATNSTSILNYKRKITGII